MRIGVVTEVMAAERRVALTPAGAGRLSEDGHEVLVEPGAGAGSGFPDAHYVAAGARLAPALEVWERSELLLKVKEPVPSEYELFHPDVVLFTYLHLAANPELAERLRESGITAVAYETVEDSAGRLSLLAPMSEIAGRLAAQAGAFFLQAPHGSGTLIGGAPGVSPARVLVLGGGTAGTQAARVAIGMGAEVTVLELSPDRIRRLDDLFDRRARVLMSDEPTLEEETSRADLVIGAVLLPGARAPRLLTRSRLGSIGEGGVFVDVAIDQGGCAETSRPTTHDDPTFVLDGVVHYCVANMPGAVPATSTRALTNATLTYVRRIAALGLDGAVECDPGLAGGVNVRDGEIACAAVAEALAAA